MYTRPYTYKQTWKIIIARVANCELRMCVCGRVIYKSSLCKMILSVYGAPGKCDRRKEICSLRVWLKFLQAAEMMFDKNLCYVSRQIVSYALLELPTRFGLFAFCLFCFCLLSINLFNFLLPHS